MTNVVVPLRRNLSDAWIQPKPKPKVSAEARNLSEAWR